MAISRPGDSSGSARQAGRHVLLPRTWGRPRRSPRPPRPATIRAALLLTPKPLSLPARLKSRPGFFSHRSAKTHISANLTDQIYWLQAPRMQERGTRRLGSYASWPMTPQMGCPVTCYGVSVCASHQSRVAPTTASGMQKSCSRGMASRHNTPQPKPNMVAARPAMNRR